MSKQTKPRKAAYRHVYTANRTIDQLRDAIAQQLTYTHSVLSQRDELTIINGELTAKIATLNRTIQSDDAKRVALAERVINLERLNDSQREQLEHLTNERNVHMENAKQLETWWNEQKGEVARMTKLLDARNKHLDESYARESAANKTITDLREQVRLLKEAIVQQALRFED